MKKRTLLKAILALALAVCLGVVGWKQVEYARGNAEYSKAAELANLPPLETVRPEGEDPGQTESNADLLASMDLESLQAANPDVKGWISIPGTPVSYPVLQAADNEYYLYRTWQGERNSMGSVFLDSTSSPDFSDFSTLVYGHRMRNGTMFGSLREYRSQDYWQAHPSVYIVCEEGVARYDIYAAFEAEVRSQVYYLNFPEEEDRAAFVSYGLEHSQLDTGLQPGPEDRFLTLSTCTGNGYARRWVVQAVLADWSDR
ncbi:MAG: class B sortase [Oscillibacter sp.]|nr:class B sortase [Oscillibacter sp.]